MKKTDRVALKKSRAKRAVGAGVLNHLAARVLVAEQKAAEAAADREQMAKSAAFWKRQALLARERAKRIETYREKPDINPNGRTVRSLARERLIKALRMLASDRADNRASATLMAEKQRSMLGKTWNELIVDEHEDIIVSGPKEPDDDNDLYDLDDDLDGEEPVS